jgi:transposase
LKQEYFMNTLGIDVAKSKLDGCLLLEGKRHKSKVVSNNAEGFASLLAWCAKQGILPAELPVLMEGTGTYHEPAAYAFFEAGARVSVLNPARVRDFAKSQGIVSKKDPLDAWVIARFGAASTPEPWQPPAPEVRHLQALLSRREALKQDLQRESHREEKLAFTPVPAPVQDSLEAHIAWLTQARDALTKEIDRHIDRHPGLKKDRALLQSIPGVGPKVSALMLALLRQGQFASAEQSAAYLGRVPVERQSGSSVKGRSRLSKNGPARVRATLYLPAVCAKRCNPHIRDMAERMALRGKCDLSIIGAAMRKLAHLCFGVIKHQLPYQPLYSKKC